MRAKLRFDSGLGVGKGKALMCVLLQACLYIVQNVGDGFFCWEMI